MTREIALHCMKSSSELEGELCEECPIYGQTGCDHCEEDALQYVIKALEQEPITKNDLTVDCISRMQAQTKIEMNASRYTISKERCGIGQVEWSDQLIKVSDAVDIIRNLPSVTPQDSKIGHWIKTPKAVMGEGYMWYCNKCEHRVYQDSSRPYPSENYCPHCGAKMDKGDK